MQTNANRIKANIVAVRSVNPRRYTRSFDSDLAAFMQAEAEAIAPPREYVPLAVKRARWAHIAADAQRLSTYLRREIEDAHCGHRPPDILQALEWADRVL